MRCVDIMSSAEHPHLTADAARSSSSSRRNRLGSASATGQHRGQLLTEAFSGKTVEVKVDGVVDVHQQEANGLDEQKM